MKAVDAVPLAALERVTFTYRDADAPALREADLSLRPGEMIGIIGASGAGKSTLIKCLNRLVPGFEDGEFRGLVYVSGRPLDGRRVCELAPQVGMVFQDFEAQLFSTNVRLEVAFAMQQTGMPRDEIVSRIGPALSAVGLAGFEIRDPTSLSGGEKQRLAIASVLALRPQIVVFDEPTTDLDPEGRAEVLELIHRLRAQGLSLVVIEHEIEELRAADRILVMRAGEIVAQGSPATILTRLELLESCGIRPPDLNRASAELGIVTPPRNLDEAEEVLRARLPALANQRTIAAHHSPIATEAVPCPAAPLAEVRALSFRYSLESLVLDTINLQICAGECLAIVGHNGSGKSTLAKQLVGLLKPSQGTIFLSGRDRATLSASESAAEIGYVFQNPDHQIFAATVEEEVAFGPRNFGLAPGEIARRVEEVLEAVGLDAMRQRDPFLLSKGERQRLAVASVIALRPRLLILDEPTTGLDYREQRRMMELVARLNRAGLAIVIITHTPWLVAEYAQRVVLMRRGRILFDGSIHDFFATGSLLQESSFRPPEITRLARRLGFSALTVDDFVAKFRALELASPQL
jgi:energy-coupling factor transport system ATP-binding protein